MCLRVCVCVCVFACVCVCVCVCVCLYEQTGSIAAEPTERVVARDYDAAAVT